MLKQMNSESADATILSAKSISSPVDVGETSLSGSLSGSPINYTVSVQIQIQELRCNWKGFVFWRWRGRWVTPLVLAVGSRWGRRPSLLSLMGSHQRRAARVIHVRVFKMIYAFGCDISHTCLHSPRAHCETIDANALPATLLVFFSYTGEVD